MRRIRAVAHANIALAKYWGKADLEQNLPAVPSLSLTLSGLRTVTEVQFDSELKEDRVSLDGEVQTGRPKQRVVELLTRARARAGSNVFAQVQSRNEFPTAAGLASSASGFAALALASTRAVGLELSPGEVSSLARRSSASAARSLFGGWASLDANAEQAQSVAPADHFPVVMIVAETAKGPKAIGSTEGMLHTARTSPFYEGWVAGAPDIYARARRALLEKDLAELGAAMEHSTLAMHASMLAADPALSYLTPTTWSVIERVRQLRSEGLAAFFTMDAGPHVKVLTSATMAASVMSELQQVPGVLRVATHEPGPAAYWEEVDA